MKPILMATYHAAVIRELEALSWVNNADEYPEQETQIVTPAVFFDVSAWRSVESSEGQTTVSLDANFYIVTDRAGQNEDIPKPAIYARALAADLSQWVDGHTFGLEGLEPAEFSDAERDTFDPAFDDYIVFRVSFTQSLPIGINEFDPDGVPLSEVWLGRVPEIGRAHIDDYRLIYRAEDNSDE